jgi:hypothetical protein
MFWEGTVKPAIGNLIAWCGGGMMLFGVLVLALQVANWISSGIWEPHPAREAVEIFGYYQPYTKLLGLNKILGWIADLPASMYLGFGGLFVLVHGMEWAEVPRHIQEQCKAKQIDKARRRLGLSD